MKATAVFVLLYMFSFPLAMGHAAFSTLTDRAIHVLGQLQHFDQICKLFHSKRIVVDAEVGKKQAGFLFFDAALIAEFSGVFRDDIT